MFTRRDVPVFVVFALMIAAAGCGMVAGPEGVPVGGPPGSLRPAPPVPDNAPGLDLLSLGAAGADVAFILLGAKEGKDFGEAEAPPPPAIDKVGRSDEKKRRGTAAGEDARFVLRVGGGFALPGTGVLGSAPGSRVPAYSDVWTTATAFEAVGESGAGKKLRPYAQVSVSQFSGQRWTNPDDANDSWAASDGSVALVALGARFGGRYYGRAAVGLMLWPEVKRIDYFSSYEEVIFEGGALLAFALGGGAEFKLGRLKAYVDVEYLMGMAPERGENAVVFWPNFEAGGMSSFKLAGGVAFSF